MLVSNHRRAIITEFKIPQEPRLDDQLKILDQEQLDLILVEGFKSEIFPKIEIHRPALKKPLLYPEDNSIIALASDTKISTPDAIKFLDLNKPESITNFIINHFLKN